MHVGMTDGRPENYNVRRLRRSEKSPLDQRRTMAWYAELHTQTRSLPSWLEDVSANGAKLRMDLIPGTIVVGEPVSLVLPNLSAIAAQVAWHRRDRIGIQFCASQPWIVELKLREIEDWFPTTMP
jgi:hypothetical protein